MKIILLKFTFCMIVICIAGGCLFYFFKMIIVKVNLLRQNN